MLMNLIPSSRPRGTTCRLSGSSASKPMKQPPVSTTSFPFKRTEDGVRMMFEGTSVRREWPLTVNFPPFRVNVDVPSTSTSAPERASVEALIKLGAIGKEKDWLVALLCLFEKREEHNGFT
ncbi:stachyose synthase [Iris pallida]|uniref:Stachyose synthase n=1 Tax=Iris pallida TaxID=29817 RepID=A0AAX6E7K9_IRIPA|nr:stachyose synthase [Iris pallida]